ncbi:glycosyltransferase [Sphingomonas tabacisoli]|uniref:Glycosyltransferase n=1 Tax=Sphingomonas tabacisoli TaxID=2249466 RepID=A0ABW4I3H9_9SPHN
MIWLAGASAAIWLYLLLFHHGFWLARERDDQNLPAAPSVWPEVVAIVPARNEADVIARSIGSLLAQDYPGPFRVILVDDSSEDGTAQIASALNSVRAEPVEALPSSLAESKEVKKGLREAQAERSVGHASFEILAAPPLPADWTGKLWAVSQGVAAAGAPSYLWLTDADIAHAPDTLRSLVARAEAGQLHLVSLMAKLHCRTLPERALVPAFVFFFQMLYPFAQANGAKGPGAAAGGCMLVRRDALEQAGGIAAIRGALIDDCTLGALIKRGGPIWLGLTKRSRSIRPYRSFGAIARMIARSAYAQLRYSPLLLLGTLAGLALVYAVPPALALFGHGTAQVLGLATWAMIALAFQPMLRFYRVSRLWGLALPAIAAFYAACTLLSALDHKRGRGGMWKGRAQAGR